MSVINVVANNPDFEEPTLITIYVGTTEVPIWLDGTDTTIPDSIHNQVVGLLGDKEYARILKNPDWDAVKTDMDGDGVADRDSLTATIQPTFTVTVVTPPAIAKGKAKSKSKAKDA